MLINRSDTFVEKLLEVSNWWQVFRYTHTTYSSGHQISFQLEIIDFCMFAFQRIFETFQFITRKSKQKQADKYKCVDEVVTICSMLGGCLRPGWFDGFLNGFYIVFLKQTMEFVLGFLTWLLRCEFIY